MMLSTKKSTNGVGKDSSMLTVLAFGAFSITVETFIKNVPKP